VTKVSNLADKIRNSEDLHSELYSIPEWGVTIMVKSMSARQRAIYASTLTSEGATDVDAIASVALSRIESLWGSMIVACCFDPETGERVFSEEDLEWLMDEKSGEVVGDLATKCLEVSGLSSDSADDSGKDSSDSQTAEEEHDQNVVSISD
jgi:hypothetical protein